MGTTAVLAAEAGRLALERAGLQPHEIDLLILCTTTPDQSVPATSSPVSAALGLRCGAFDLNAACSGFVYGLVTAAAMTRARFETVLLIGAETLSRITDTSDPSTGMLFGDGAGAVVVKGTSGGSTAGLLAWDLGCDGTATGILGQPAGGSLLPASAATVDANQHVLQMEGREVYRRAVRAVVDSATVTLERAGVRPEDVTLFIPHQANARIVDGVLPRIGIPAERTFMNIERYGNTSAASIPIALAEACEQRLITDGDLVLMTGFGAGMTWASALVRWGRP
jgi:3-oxoacyl-[acyl-carrier-protein] synthase-3